MFQYTHPFNTTCNLICYPYSRINTQDAEGYFFTKNLKNNTAKRTNKGQNSKLLSFVSSSQIQKPILRGNFPKCWGQATKLKVLLNCNEIPSTNMKKIHW